MRRSRPLWILASALVGAACGTSHSGSQSVQVTLEGAATLACPSDAPGACGDTCCPSGATCAATDCSTNVSATSLCSSSNPVTCGSPSTAADSSGQANHLTLTAPADFVVGRFATGVSDGCQAQTSCPAGIQGPAHGFPAGDTAITIEAWVRPGGAGFVDL